MTFRARLTRQWVRLNPCPNCISGSLLPDRWHRGDYLRRLFSYSTRPRIQAPTGGLREPGLPERGFTIHPTRRSSLLKTAQWRLPTSRELRTGEPIPVDVAVLAHSTLLPQVGGQPKPFRQGQKVLSLLDQQGIRPLPCRPMPQPTGYTIAPLQGLPVQVGRVREANTGPHIAPGVPDPALHIAIGLGREGQVQPQLETHPQGESSIHQFHSGRLDSSQPTTTLALSCKQWSRLSMWLPRITRVWEWTAGYFHFYLYYMGFWGASVSNR